MTYRQERQLIDSLFQNINQHAIQAGPRDPQVEELIEHRVGATPGATYHMAQMLIGQQQLIAQLQQQLAYAHQQAQTGFAPPYGGAGQQGWGPQPQPGWAPGYQQPQRGGGGGGFLQGAGMIALGVGGGLLGAELIGDLFDGDDDGLF